MIDKVTKREIDKVVRQTLKEAGLGQPPIRVEDLLAHLELDRDFYSLENPTLLQRLKHKVKVRGKKLIRIINKVRLAAVWLPDQSRILVDETLPAPKKDGRRFTT